MKQTTSFSLSGFWYHLSFKGGCVYLDQHGMEWYKQGNQFISQGGGMVYSLPKPVAMKNEDWLVYHREMNRLDYHARMLRNL